MLRVQILQCECNEEGCFIREDGLLTDSTQISSFKKESGPDEAVLKGLCSAQLPDPFLVLDLEGESVEELDRVSPHAPHLTGDVPACTREIPIYSSDLVELRTG